MRRPVPVLAAVLAVGSMLASAGPAAADDPLAPGRSSTVVVPVPETWAAEAVQVTVTVGDLVQVENGCLEPEEEAGDDCSSAVGELAGKLTTVVAWGRTEDDDCAPAADPVRLDLFGTTTARLTDVRGVDCLLLELTFPDGDTDDVAQSDGLTFALDLVAQGLPDPIAPDDDDAAGGGAGQGGTGQTDTGQDGAGQDGAGRNDTGQAGTGPGAAGAGGQGPGTVPATGAVAGVPVAPDGTGTPTSGGDVVDRIDAQVAVGDDGVAVETQADDTSLRDSLLAWGGLLLGAVALGWVGFWMFLRRRRRSAAGAVT